MKQKQKAATETRITVDEILAQVQETLAKYETHYERNWGHPVCPVLYQCHYIVAATEHPSFTIKPVTVEGRKRILRSCTDSFPTQYTKEQAELIVSSFLHDKDVELVAVLDRDWYAEQIKSMKDVIDSLLEQQFVTMCEREHQDHVAALGDPDDLSHYSEANDEA